MLRAISLFTALAIGSVVPALADDAASLRGSPTSMLRQNAVAKEVDYTFLRTPTQVREFAEKGHLVRLEGNDSYAVAEFVSFPYARPEIRTFVERLSAQYREGCGERLVVTSLTRPTSGQPANAHALSVHPAGMAVDLRVSPKAACREWLESTLLSLERRGLLDVTRERKPPHYHVAVFPDAYRSYVEQMVADSAKQAESEALAAAARRMPAVQSKPVEVQQASLAPRVEPSEASGSGFGTAVSLALLVLAPLALTVPLELRRRQSHAQPTRDLE